jgi:SP family general alpha glucoside:H+ symporter-like MFS transporter
MLTSFQGRSYYEIDVMFERKIPARQFKNYVVEMDADEEMRREQGIVRS